MLSFDIDLAYYKLKVGGMVQENELVTLLIGTAVLIFMCCNGTRLKALPRSRIFFTAYGVLMTAWVLTVIEGFFWRDTINILEHACYAGGSILLACWCWLVFARSPQCR